MNMSNAIYTTGITISFIIVFPLIVLVGATIGINILCERLKRPPKKTSEIITELKESNGVISTFAHNQPRSKGDTNIVLEGLEKSGIDISKVNPADPMADPVAVAPPPAPELINYHNIITNLMQQNLPSEELVRQLEAAYYWHNPHG